MTGAGAEAPRRTDVAIVGAGAAGLFAGIWAGLAIYTIDNLLQQRRTAALAVR